MLTINNCCRDEQVKPVRGGESLLKLVFFKLSTTKKMNFKTTEHDSYKVEVYNEYTDFKCNLKRRFTWS